MKSRVNGLNKLLKQIDELGAEANKMAVAVVQSTADGVVTQAKRNAPANLGKLRQSIGKTEEKGGFQAKIFAGEKYAPYIEFGTGTYVSVPPELQSLALQFKGKGSGSFEAFLQAIKDWVRQKGIGDPEKIAYPIAMSILRKGIRPQPFIYPAFVEGRKKLTVTMRKAYHALVKKYNAK